MSIPPDFVFSQSNLQDFVDCPRRFELRYLLRQPWPAPQSEPTDEWEHRLLQGQRFHHLIYQFFSGLPAETLSLTVHDKELSHWWQNLLSSTFLTELPEKQYPEFTLSAPFAGFRLIAKYDLIAVEPGRRLIIVDWKTFTPRAGTSYLRQRIQSRLYPLLMIEAGHTINCGTVDPSQIEMIYWFVEQPEAPLRFQYNQEEYPKDHEYLTELIKNIVSRKPGEFELTFNEKLCAFCNYRSLCNRGERAGNLSDLNEEPYQESEDTIQIDFDQIGEIQF